MTDHDCRLNKSGPNLVASIVKTQAKCRNLAKNYNGVACVLDKDFVYYQVLRRGITAINRGKFIKKTRAREKPTRGKVPFLILAHCVLSWGDYRAWRSIL